MVIGGNFFGDEVETDFGLFHISLRDAAAAIVEDTYPEPLTDEEIENQIRFWATPEEARADFIKYRNEYSKTEADRLKQEILDALKASILGRELSPTWVVKDLLGNVDPDRTTIDMYFLESWAEERGIELTDHWRSVVDDETEIMLSADKHIKAIRGLKRSGKSWGDIKAEVERLGSEADMVALFSENQALRIEIKENHDQAARGKPLKTKERDNLLRTIGAMALMLTEQGGPRLGTVDKPNFSQLGKSIDKFLAQAGMPAIDGADPQTLRKRLSNAVDTLRGT